MGMSGPRILVPGGYTAFVPNGDSRRETAIILIGYARDAGLDDARHVRAVQGGFYISDELADLLYDEPEDSEPEPEPEVSGNSEAEAPKATKRSSTKKASGNRAAKNSTTEKE